MPITAEVEEFESTLATLVTSDSVLTTGVTSFSGWTIMKGLFRSGLGVGGGGGGGVDAFQGS